MVVGIAVHIVAVVAAHTAAVDTAAHIVAAVHTAVVDIAAQVVAAVAAYTVHTAAQVVGIGVLAAPILAGPNRVAQVDYPYYHFPL